MSSIAVSVSHNFLRYYTTTPQKLLVRVFDSHAGVDTAASPTAAGNAL
jgi:hypothetical protein